MRQSDAHTLKQRCKSTCIIHSELHSWIIPAAWWIGAILYRVETHNIVTHYICNLNVPFFPLILLTSWSYINVIIRKTRDHLNHQKRATGSMQQKKKQTFLAFRIQPMRVQIPSFNTVYSISPLFIGRMPWWGEERGHMSYCGRIVLHTRCRCNKRYERINHSETFPGK